MLWLHCGVPPLHRLAHVPHVAAVARSASQPFAAMPSQSAKPVTHANPHAVPSHVGVAFGIADGHGEHDVPQPRTLVFRVQLVPHAWYSALHLSTQAPATHVGVPSVGAVHAAMHAPQFAGSVLTLASQAFDASPSQSRNPGRHA